MPRKSTTTPTSDSINEGQHGQVPMVTQEVSMTNKAQELGINVVTSDELEAMVGVTGEERFQPEWSEVFKVDLLPEGCTKDTCNAVQFTVAPNTPESYVLFGAHAYPSITIGKMFLNDLRFGAYADVTKKSVIFKTDPAVAVARGHMENFAYFRFNHGGDFGQYGVVAPPPSGWKALSTGSNGAFVGSMSITDQNIQDYWNNQSPWANQQKEGMWVASFYRMEALYSLLNGFNVRVKLGPQSRRAVMDRYAVWSESDLVEAQKMANNLDWAGRERRRQYAATGVKQEVLDNGGTVAAPIIPAEQTTKTKFSVENGALSLMSSNGVALVVGSIPFPTRIRVTQGVTGAVVYADLTLGKDANKDYFQLGNIIENLFEVEVL